MNGKKEDIITRNMWEVPLKFLPQPCKRHSKREKRFSGEVRPLLNFLGYTKMVLGEKLTLQITMDILSAQWNIVVTVLCSGNAFLIYFKSHLFFPSTYHWCTTLCWSTIIQSHEIYCVCCLTWQYNIKAFSIAFQKFFMIFTKKSQIHQHVFCPCYEHF